MKNIILTTTLLFLTLIGFSQNLTQITITTDTLQEMTWPLEISLNDAKESDKVNYESVYVGHSVYTINLKNKKLTMTSTLGLLEFDIVKFEKLSHDGYYLEAFVDNETRNVKLLLSQKVENTEYVLFVMYPDYEKSPENIGYLSVNTKVKIK